MPTDQAREAIRSGSISLRIKRAGMFQFQTFKIRKITLGKEQFVELYLPKIVDVSELHRIANELDLPVEAENGLAFPEGKGAKDFTNV
jgi:hypothetical protein